MVYGERINELLEHTDISADPDVDYYNHADKLDSVMLMAESDGDQAESYRYKEYGEQTVVDSSFAKLSTYSSNIGNWKRYTGQEHALPSSFGDPWYFYRARVYRADAGMFVQRDPIRYGAGSNLYAYVGNDPLVSSDPFGTSPSPPGQVWVPGYGWTAPGIPGTVTQTPNGGTIVWLPDPPDPPGKEDAACCDKVKARDSEAAAAGGFIGCCNGQMHICVNVSEEVTDIDAWAIVYACTITHETDHYDTGEMYCPCGADENCAAKFSDPMHQNENECSAYTAELECLNTLIRTCPNQFCWDQVKKEKDIVEGNKNSWCN